MPETPGQGGPAKGSRNAKKPKGFSGFFLLVALISLFILLLQMHTEPNVSNSPYLFLRYLFAGRLRKVRVEENRVRAEVEPREGAKSGLPGEESGPAPTEFEVVFSNIDPTLEEMLRDVAAWASQVDTHWAGGGKGVRLFLEDARAGKVKVSKAWVLHIQEPSPGEGGKTRSWDKVYLLASTERGQVYGVLFPDESDPQGNLLAVEKVLQAQGARVERLPIADTSVYQVVQPNKFLLVLLTTVGPWVLLLGLVWFFFFRQMRAGPGGGVLSFGKSRATLYNKENRTNTTFADVAGIEEAKEEVAELVEFLKNPQRFQRLGGRIPKGVLLVGPPGTGKTLLARAIAGEAEVPFFSISGSDFVEMFVGVGASRVRDLFKQARENSPCLIFLDEVDAVGRKRGSGLGGGHDEREQTLNAILVEMDGFDTDEGIILIAATNRPDVLDPALLRPGRFDRQITIDYPDVKGRLEILKVHARKIQLADDVDLEVIAKATPSFSGAELAALINEAAILASVKDKDAVHMEDLEEARDRIRWGREKRSRAVEEEDRRITAYHEAGHALAAVLMPEVGALHKVTIIPRGMALGATMSLPEKDDYHMGRKKLKSMLVHLLAGRASEQVCCEDISAGAENDIRRATQIARLMVAEWGMSEKIGPVSYTRPPEHNFLGRDFSFGKEHSENVAFEIDMEVKGLLEEALQRAQDMCRENKEILDRIARALLKKETLTGNEVKAIVRGEDPDSIPPEERWATTGKREETDPAGNEEGSSTGESPAAEEPSPPPSGKDGEGAGKEA